MIIKTRVNLLTAPSELSLKKPLWKKALILFCGLEDDQEQKMSEEELEMMTKKMISIEEEKWPAIFVDIAGIAMCCAGCFLFAFYA